jgi:integrase
VHDRTGKPIVGLSREPKSGRFYVTGTRPRLYLGADYDQSVMRFRTWEAQKRSVRLIAKEPLIPDKQQREAAIAEGWISRDKAEQLIPWAVFVTEESYFEKLRNLLISRPTYVAERTGIPQLSHLSEIEPREPSLALTAVWKLYESRRKRASAHWERKMRRFWQDFVDAVGVRTLRDVDREAIDAYHDSVWTHAERKGFSSTYVKQRLEAIPTILRVVLRKGRDVATARRVLDLCASFEKPDARGVDPNPITPLEFHQVLDAADEKWKAVLLLALNAALYPAEVAAVERSHLDLDKATFVMDRGKTGRPRIAVLWSRTIDAIRRYHALEPHESAPLFVNANGAAYNGNHITRNFRRRRAEAGLGAEVTFDRIRDGSYSAAIEGGADLTQANLIAGHACGIADHYVKRNPRMVADACAAIERHYFGLPAKTERRTSSARKR